jgi:transcription initiation factor IIE alpha subunit
MANELSTEQAYEAAWTFARGTDVNPRARVLLLALARTSGRSSTAEELAQASGVSLDRTRRALRKLRAKNVVRSSQVVREGKWVYGWDLNLENLAAAPLSITA